MEKPELLIVDDEAINLAVLDNTLSPHYRVRACRSGEQALEVVRGGNPPDLVLLDILMTGIDGFETLRRIREDERGREIPVIFISALGGTVDEERGFQLGAVDYITKPFRPALVLARVRAQLELKRGRDLLRDKNAWLEAEVARRMRETQLIQDTTLVVVTQLAETRDSETAHHILRTRAYVERLARRMQTFPAYAKALDESTLQLIVKAAPLHDIGKIGIRDAILLKPGKLDEAEYDVMKSHCRIGGDVIRRAMAEVLVQHDNSFDGRHPVSLRFLEMAETIALHHHERWDGTGYPAGLAGEAIPLPARMMALADVFDALTTPRVYKAEWQLEQASGHILDQSGHHFDPDVVAAYRLERQAFFDIHARLSDDNQGRRHE